MKTYYVGGKKKGRVGVEIRDYVENSAPGQPMPHSPNFIYLETSYSKSSLDQEVGEKP